MSGCGDVGGHQINGMTASSTFIGVEWHSYLGQIEHLDLFVRLCTTMMEHLRSLWLPPIQREIYVFISKDFIPDRALLFVQTMGDVVLVSAEQC